MKYTALILFAAVLSLAACATGTDGKKHLTPEGKAALVELGGDALTIGLSALTGSPSVPSGLDGAAALIRSLAGSAVAPSHSELTTAIASGTGSPSVTAAIAPALVPKIQAAIAKGAPPDAALEVAAAKLNKAAATGVKQSIP